MAEHEQGAGPDRVALKVLRGTLAGTEEVAQRFAREIETLRRLDHRGIVAARGELGRDGDVHYYPMELVVGRDLAALLRAQGALEPDQAIGLACQVLDALAAAHRVGVVHRDVKPGNVLVDREGRARLTDFGLAQVADRSRLTAGDSILGTPAYLSPEQARGEDATEQSDLYSLGALLFELLTGRPPFQAENPVALLRQHIDEKAPSLAEIAPDLPPSLCEHVQRVLSKTPATRFATADAMADALRSVLAPDQRAAAFTASTAILRERVIRELESTNALPPAPPPRKRNPWLAVVALLALGGGVAGLYAMKGRATNTPEPPASASPTPSKAVSPEGMRASLHFKDGSTQEVRLLGFSRENGSLRCWDEVTGEERVVPRNELKEFVLLDNRGEPPR